ncbi:MAG: hypothetical protein C4346_12970 [Chloroflexota bacterium]
MVLRQIPTHARAVLQGRGAAAISLTVAACIWGSSAVSTKAALAHWPPLTLAFVRWSLAAVIILLVLRRSGQRPASGPGIAVLGLTGLVLFYVFFSWGLTRTTATDATLIGGGSPVIVAVLSAMFLNERITRRRLLGIITSLAGVVLIAGHGFGGMSTTTIMGNLLIFCSTTSWAIYIVVGRRVSAGGNALATLAGTALYGLAFMLPLVVLELATTDLPMPNRAGMLLMLYLALGPSLIAYYLWGYGLTRLEASQAAVYGNLMPLVGVVAASVFLHERIGALQLIGGAIIITGVWLATTGSRASLPPRDTSGAESRPDLSTSAPPQRERPPRRRPPARCSSAPASSPGESDSLAPAQRRR